MLFWIGISFKASRIEIHTSVPLRPIGNRPARTYTGTHTHRHAHTLLRLWVNRPTRTHIVTLVDEQTDTHTHCYSGGWTDRHAHTLLLWWVNRPTRTHSVTLVGEQTDTHTLLLWWVNRPIHTHCYSGGYTDRHAHTLLLWWVNRPTRTHIVTLQWWALFRVIERQCLLIVDLYQFIHSINNALVIYFA